MHDPDALGAHTPEGMIATFSEKDELMGNGVDNTESRGAE